MQQHALVRFRVRVRVRVRVKIRVREGAGHLPVFAQIELGEAVERAKV